MSDMLRRAEMRWMSVEDAEITVSARELAELGRERDALAARAEKAEAALRRLWGYEPGDTETSADEWAEIEREVRAALADSGETE